ncbi:MAG: hypothetical protein A2X45_16930 [Lentisphaerae bacterium GWF2_50_93]|nr:MAG: hypothetical protein A2X45_16930 [Lentisphaerae bacterium GWF2_50_93]
MTITAARDDYIGHLKGLNYSVRTVRSVDEIVSMFALFLSGEGVALVEEIHSAHVVGWQRHVASGRTRNGLPLNPGTMNNRIKNAKGFLKYLAGKRLVPSSLPDELHYVNAPVLLPTSVLTHEQFGRMAARIDTATTWGYQARTIVELMYSSGLRAGEVLGIRLHDIDYRNGVAKVLGKGNKERVVPVGRTALKYLDTYVKGVRPFLVKGGCDRLFLNNRGGPLHYKPLLQWIRRFCHDPDVHVTPHTFRRSCATEMIRGSANLWHVKELLGHESLDTLKHYAKLTIVDLKRTHRKCHPREMETQG